MEPDHYLAWLLMFGIYRYIVPIEMLAPLLIEQWVEKALRSVLGYSGRGQVAFEQLPIPTTSFNSSTDGTLITHSRLLRMISKLKLLLAITHPTKEGENSMTVCHPRVMMLAFPFQAELIRTIGPGSRKRLISETGKSFFSVVLHSVTPLNR